MTSRFSMSPYLRPDSRYFQVRRRKLPGFGDTGVLSTRTTSRRLAERMERLLEEIAERALVEPAYTALLEAVRSKQITLPDLLRARSERRLPVLLRQLNDPPLLEALRRFQNRRSPDRQTTYGLEKIASYAPREARLSWLADPARLLTMLHDLEAGDSQSPKGRKRNTVRRQVYRAASLVLRAELGRAERDRIMGEVDYPAEGDTREVLITPEEIARLLQSAADLGYEELRTLILMALLTSADRGVLLAGARQDGRDRGLLVRDLRMAIIYVLGPKV